MRSRGSLRRSVAAVIAVGALLSSTSTARADDVSSSKARVNQLADQLNNLENRLGQLDEEYGAAQDRKAALDLDIAASEAKIAEQQARLDQLAGVLGSIAVDKYVSGTSLELSPLFSTAAAYSEAEQKDSLTHLAIDAGAGSTDEVNALAEDLAKERASLDRKHKQAEELVASLDSKLAEGKSLQTEYTQKLASANAELGAAVEQERERRAEEAAAAEVARQKQAAADAAAATAAANQTSNLVAAPRGGGTASGGGQTPADPTPSAGSGGGGGDPGGGNSAPPVSSRAGTAVNAAMGQLGVSYQFAAEAPGVAFDCSGLTKYAWGQAGVGLPHQSAAQYGSIPHISQAEIQPGDLVFYKAPIGHVAIYIGGGQMIHAPSPGKVVSIATVNWAKVVGIGRPG